MSKKITFFISIIGFGIIVGLTVFFIGQQVLGAISVQSNLNMLGNNIDMSSGRITNLPVPTEPDDVARKSYVDSVMAAADDGDWTISGNDIYRTTGNVGIGTPSPEARLHIKAIPLSRTGIKLESGTTTNHRRMWVSGTNDMNFSNDSNAARLSAVGSWVNASDIAYKKDIVDIDYGLDDLMKLQPRSYRMKADNLEQIGFIAQEVEQIIPEVVSGEEGQKGISYGNLSALTIKAIQEQQGEIEELKQEIKELKAIINK